MQDKDNTRHPSHRLLPQIIVTVSETFILTISIGIVYILNLYINFNAFVNFIIFFILQAIATLIVLKIIRTFVQFKSGVHFLKKAPRMYDAYLSYLYLYYVNLGIFWAIDWPGFLFRNIIYKYVGCKKSKNSLLNGAKIIDPLFVSIGDNTILGEESLVIGHAITIVNGQPAFILGKISIGENSLIGARSIIFPDTVIGDNTVIRANAVVPSYSRIPSNEIWGGDPAKKIGENILK